MRIVNNKTTLIDLHYKWSNLNWEHKCTFYVCFLDEFWVSMQSSGDVVVFFCLERASGRCSKSRVELLSQDNTPVNFHKLKTFTEANEKHICQKYDMYIDQRGGKQVIQPSTVKPAHAVTCIKRSCFPCSVMENLI